MTTIVHPNYDEATTNNDIALLKLGEESHNFVGNLHLAIEFWKN